MAAEIKNYISWPLMQLGMARWPTCRKSVVRRGECSGKRSVCPQPSLSCWAEPGWACWTMRWPWACKDTQESGRAHHTGVQLIGPEHNIVTRFLTDGDKYLLTCLCHCYLMFLCYLHLDLLASGRCKLALLLLIWISLYPPTCCISSKDMSLCPLSSWFSFFLNGTFPLRLAWVSVS